MLDIKSLSAAKSLLVRAGTMATVAFVLRLAYNAPLTVPLALLTITYALTTCVSGTLAVCCRDPFCRGSLNHWDGAIAFLAISRLTHLFLYMQR